MRNTTDRSSGDSATTATGQTRSCPSCSRCASSSTTARPSTHVAATTLGTNVALGHPGLVLPDELPQLLVAADLTGAGIVDDHLTGPHVLESVGVTVVQRR